MRKFSRRIAVWAIVVAVFSYAAFVGRSAAAGDWEYSDVWGGYLDWETGLVWGEQKGISTWDGSVAYIGRLSVSTGLPWRQPTVAECQLAAAHGICGAIPSTATGRDCWTADSKSKGTAKSSHYAVVFVNLPTLTLDSVHLCDNKFSFIDSIPVYRLFTP